MSSGELLPAFHGGVLPFPCILWQGAASTLLEHYTCMAQQLVRLLGCRLGRLANIYGVLQIGGLLSFNVIFPSDQPSIARLIG